MRATAGAADSTTVAWAGALVQQETQDFIDLLRPMSVYSRIPAGSTVTFDTTNSIKLPEDDHGYSGWLGVGGRRHPGQGRRVHFDHFGAKQAGRHHCCHA